MLRKAMARKTIDYNPSIIRYLEVEFLIINFLLFKRKYFLEFNLAKKFN
jgi:hypothetical protein